MSTSVATENEAADDHTAPAPTTSRVLRWGGAAALCVAVGLAGIWAERRTIATQVIDRKLAEAHVRARYRVVDLGLGRQRLVDVVIGDPARPDLSADWLELGTHIGLDGAQVTAVRAGRLRLRASLANGTLSLGQLDRLLPRSTAGGPFRFPAVDLDVADGRVQLTTPPGIVDLALTGHGRLDDGFRGRLTATSEHLAANGCTLAGLSAAATVGIEDGAPTLVGPVKANRLACAGGVADGLAADVTATLARRFTGWHGQAAVRAARLAAASAVIRRTAGRITFAGTSTATTGTLALASGPAAIGGVTGRALSLAGHYRWSNNPAFAGRVAATGAALPPATIAAVRRQGNAAPATPIAPLLGSAARALALAASDADVAAAVAVTRRGVTLTDLHGSARSGAQASFAPDRPLFVAWGTMPAVAGTIHLAGGGLPTATAHLAQAAPGEPISGVVTMLPYQAGGARLAFDPVRFTAGSQGTRVTTIATLSGSLADGRVDGLRVPIAASWVGNALSVDPDCITLSFDRLAVSTLRLGAARLPLCPTGPALVRFGTRGVEGGARIATLRLAGSLGTTALMLAADDTRLSLGASGVTAHHVAARLGTGDAATQLDIGQLDAAIAADGLAGRFAGAAGRIGTVPLLLSQADGDWRFAHGALTLAGTATIADAAAADRFKPLRAEAMTLRLANGAIAASAHLATTGKAVAVADVKIAHDLGSGTGHAALAVPRLAFTEAFQPDELTPLTFGVIADVRGTVVGNARIDWTAAGVTSTGTFRSDGLDLAAAFGPVSGLAGTIHFTDLLAMQSAPGQVATVASINPGIPVTDGRVVYRTLPNDRVEVTGGHWPFAGGSLDLQPTVLDFGQASQRHLTFELNGVDAGRFLQQFDFDNLNATGTFDGTLPMVFDADGGRIEAGHLQVRRGGGNLAYVGNLSQKDLGIWGNLAFQALRSINYRTLSIALNGPLSGEMITDVRFAGISQGKGAKSNFLIRRLQKLPFVFNIKIKAPFRGLLDSAQSFYDPSRLIVRNLPALLQQQNQAAAPPPPLAVQPAARETIP